jgi:hypothetical protein
MASKHRAGRSVQGQADETGLGLISAGGGDGTVTPGIPIGRSQSKLSA